MKEEQDSYETQPFSMSLWSDTHKPFANESYKYRTGSWEDYDFDNLLPQRLLDLYVSSPMHAGIVNKLSKMISGYEVILKNGDVKCEDWLENVNMGAGIFDLVQKVTLDYYLFGGFAVEIIPYKFQEGIKEIKHVPFQNFRVGKKDEEWGVYYSTDWLNPVYKSKPTFIPFYSKDLKETSIMYHRDHNPMSSYYPLPSYYSAYSSILSEIELINFTKSNIQQGFFPSSIIQISNELTKSQVEDLKKAFNTNFTGTKNGGAVMFIPGTKEKPLSITPMSTSPADFDVSTLIQSIRNSIVMGHSIPSPALVGMPDSGSLGTSGITIEQAQKTLHNDIVLPKRKTIETFFNKIIKKAGYLCEIELIGNEMLEETQTDTQENENS